MMEEPLLQVKNLCYCYEQNRYALRDVCVEIGAGEKIAVLGENGAGKSTFFLHLNGVREQSSGEVYLQGEKIEKRTRGKLTRSVGIVFQEADSQIIGSTVKADIAFAPWNQGLRRAEVEHRISRVAKALHLEAYLDRPPHNLSGGEKKRVSIAATLAMDARIIIFDEPTASLDGMHRELLEQILAGLRAEGRTVMVATHDIDFAYRFAERILLFHGGRLIADGKAEQIFLQKEILKQAHLKQPVMLELSELLQQRKLLKRDQPYPKTVQELSGLLRSACSIEKQ